MNASVTFVTLLLVEYCSYKGLTHKIALGHSSFFSVEYCSYKGLTPFAFPYFKISVIG